MLGSFRVGGNRVGGWGGAANGGEPSAAEGKVGGEREEEEGEEGAAGAQALEWGWGGIREYGPQ